MSTTTIAPPTPRRPAPAPLPRLSAPVPVPAPAGDTTRSTSVAAQLERLADLVLDDPTPSPDLVADVLAALISAAAAQVDGLGLRPPERHAPAVVQQRAIGRLAARTVGRSLVLDADTAARLEAIWCPDATVAEGSEPSTPCSGNGRSSLLDVA